MPPEACASSAVDAVAPAQAHPWALLRHWMPAAVIGGLVALLYLPVFPRLVESWVRDPLLSHGLLVAPVTAAFARWRWPRILAEPRSGSAWGACGVALAIGLLVVARQREDLFLQELSLVALVPAIVWSYHGARRTRLLAPALALPFFALPYPFLAEAGPWLQALAAGGAGRILALGGIPVQRDVFTIVAAGIPFEVAPLCSGLSSIVSLSFAAFVATSATELPAGWQVGLTASALPLAVAGNLVRIVATVAVGVRFGPDAAAGAFHAASDAVLFLAILAPILVSVLRLRRRFHG